jgi:PadR family transcriptional regulator PadR
MIGGQLPPAWRRQATSAPHPAFDRFRLELRRGCVALAVLAELRTEQYGYALGQALAKRGLTIEAGTLYPLLRRLESSGLLLSERRRDGKRDKRFYRLTTDGWRMLDQLREEWTRIDSALLGILHRVRQQVA